MTCSNTFCSGRGKRGVMAKKGKGSWQRNVIIIKFQWVFLEERRRRQEKTMVNFLLLLLVLLLVLVLPKTRAQCLGRTLGTISPNPILAKNQPVTCCDLSVFLWWFEAYSIYYFKMTGNFHEVLNFNWLFLKLNLVHMQPAVNSSCSLLKHLTMVSG